MRDFERPGRSAAYAEHGMAATSHPAATLTALDVLRAGGNAVDAAVAAMAVHCVVEPGMTGIGGDCFVLLGRPDGEVVALNGSGRAPAAATAQLLAEQGVTSLDDSVHAITVPGAVDAWARLLAAHGSRGLDELLRPAIRYAEDGFLVTPRVAYDWANARERIEQSEAGRAYFLPSGMAPVAGQRVRLPALARTLRRIAEHGRDAFYVGEIAEQIAIAGRAPCGRGLRYGRRRLREPHKDLLSRPRGV
jgi:gamma-glutamyltranspeptidase/glutathione hydrolase